MGVQGVKSKQKVSLEVDFKARKKESDLGARGNKIQTC